MNNFCRFLIHAEVVVATMREEFAAVDAEELAEDSSYGDYQSDDATAPAKAHRLTQSFAGFKAASTLAVAEDISPTGFGGGQAVGSDRVLAGRRLGRGQGSRKRSVKSFGCQRD